jgi:putative transferase (TIGR04331 family)
MDADVLPYHWDDRAKLFSDHQYLQGFHERLLEDLTSQLNRIHGVERGIRYWRILLGPWLGHFIPILFDRWCSVHQAIEQYELSGTVVLSSPGGPPVLNDMAVFRRVMTEDEWNHQLFSTVLKWVGEVPITQQKSAVVKEPKSVTFPRWQQRLREHLISGYSGLASLFMRDHDLFSYGPYLSRSDEMRMYRRMGQIPQVWRSIPPIQVPVDSNCRDWSLNGLSDSEFEDFACSLIPHHIPVAYLEGYSQLVRQTCKLPWPKQPSLIWTGGVLYEDDVFKCWAAEKVEQGTPLVVSQHGGHYGTGLWSFCEDHELAISDCFMSWGWAKSGEPTVRPVGQIKSKRPLSVQHGKQKGALLVTNSVPRFSSLLRSMCVSRQYLDYLDDQHAFVSALPQTIRQNLTVRLYPHDYGWDQHSRWGDHFPDLALDDGHSRLNDLIRQSRVYIATCNTTTFLESFTMDVPTVIFWNPNQWELRESAIPYFEDLKRVGIFHETPESAARQVATIWDNVDSWWNSPLVRQVLKTFKERYSHLPNDLLDRIEHTLRDAMASSDVSY